MRTSVKKLLARVEAFVGDVSFSAPGGGWAPVAEGAIDELSGILKDVIACKYQTDADGDVPVEFHLIDRTRFQRPHYFLIPYTHRAKTSAEYETALANAITNMTIAANALDVLHRCRAELLRREAEKAKAKP